MSGTAAPVDHFSPLKDSARPFPVVGIGASAGGLAAFEAFFAGMPAEDPGMAFVLVQHLAPQYKSILTALIQRTTYLPVAEVEDGMAVECNHVYIIPPNCILTLASGKFRLVAQGPDRRPHLPINTFFHSLSIAQKQNAICIILSGTGGDGTLGARSVKEGGGIVIAQSLSSAQYEGMPRSVIEAGLADYQLPPAEMPAQLMHLANHAAADEPHPLALDTPQASATVKKILALLRARTGHDFSLYKSTTLHRRIERRMMANKVESSENYVKLLQVTPGEVDALFRDILIGVTSFFRDAEAFHELEQQVIPQLIANEEIDPTIRVWSAGCSTGEEAYSVAILIAECQAALKRNCRIQIFATDIDSTAIATARVGIYPAESLAAVPAEWLARYFAASADGSTFRINKNIRDMLIFSEHDILKDPPFSRVDLILCRNLMIYLNHNVQRKLVELFHYALRPSGFLFLGISSTIGDTGNLFDLIHARYKIYQRRHELQQPPLGHVGGFLPHATSFDVPPQPAKRRTSIPATLPLRELTERALLQEFAPSSAALVNGRGDILYLHGRTGQFLEPAPGETGINNILKMAREGLRYDLRSALHRASSTNSTVTCPGLRMRTNEGHTSLDLTVSPLASMPAGNDANPAYFLVAFRPSPVPLPASYADIERAAEPLPPEAEALIAKLHKELQAKEDFLSAANEELEAANEELCSSNEEMQSINEELQSANEELETSKEELQSVNEELSTVNAELQGKVTELSQANNDMNNMLAGTGIGTVFIDHQLRILRFTPPATAIINLIPGDVGRPVNHILTNLVGYDSLGTHALSVIESLVPYLREVQTKDGRSYSMRIQPYRTQENVIEGAVVTFTEITQIVEAREMLRQANESLRLARIVRDSGDAFIRQDLNGRIQAWNPAAERIYGWTEAEALTLHVTDMLPPALRAEASSKPAELASIQLVAPYHSQRMTKYGKILNVFVFSSALVDELNQMYGIATMERPISEVPLSQPEPGS